MTTEDFPKIYAAIARTEQKFGLDALEHGERVVLAEITKIAARGQEVTIPMIEQTNVQTRASTYRHIYGLRDKKIIYLVPLYPRGFAIRLAPRLSRYPSALTKAVSKVAA